MSTQQNYSAAHKLLNLLYRAKKDLVTIAEHVQNTKLLALLLKTREHGVTFPLCAVRCFNANRVVGLSKSTRHSAAYRPPTVWLGLHLQARE